MYESFVRYQSRLIQVFDDMSGPYGFQMIDASQPPVKVFESLQTAISKIVQMEAPRARRSPVVAAAKGTSVSRRRREPVK
jgi:hypothetical protein